VKRIISIAVAALLCRAAYGMDFRKGADQGHPGHYTIYASGQIVPGDSITFEKLATEGPIDIVFFSSPGGSLTEGLAIGAIIRKRSITTAVSAPNSCYSACTFAWLGGRLRLLADGADVGSHAAFIDDNGVKREKGSGNAVVGAYLSMLGLQIDGIAYLTSASPDNVVHITRLTARKYGIAVSFVDNNGDIEEVGYPAVPTAPPISPAPSSPAGVSTPAASSPATRCRVMDPTGTPLNVRTSPKGTVVAALPNGMLVSIIDRAIDQHGRTWVYIGNYDTRQPIGWVFREFIACF
jgi:hypothetical protein